MVRAGDRVTFDCAPNEWPQLDMQIEVKVRYAARCPINGGVDSGFVSLAYTPCNRLVEIDSWAAFIATYAERAITAEAMTGELISAVRGQLQPNHARVTLICRHAGGALSRTLAECGR